MIKDFKNEDYDLLCDWWRKREWPPIPLMFLSKRGFISYIDDKPIIAGFLLKDETCSFGMFEWIVANPDSTTEERKSCLSELLSHAESVAKDIGCLVLVTATKSDRLAEKFIDNGYATEGEKLTYLMKGL